MNDIDFRKKFYQNVEPRQALDPRNKEFYVELDDAVVRGDDISRRLLTDIEFSSGDSVSLVTGPRGSGKSTELLRIANKQLETSNKRPILYADVEEFLGTNEPIEPAEFFPVLVAGLIQAISTLGYGIDITPFTERLSSFFRRIRADVNLAVAVEEGPISLSASLKPYLKDDNSFKSEIQNYLTNNRREFREEMHSIINDVTSALRDIGPTPVFIMDSLEHFRGTSLSHVGIVDSIKTLFSDFVDELSLPGLHVVYCVPSYVNCNRANTYPMLNVKVSTLQNDCFGDYEEGITQLREVLEKRVPQNESLTRLLNDKITQNLVICASGGLFRDLFRLVGAIITDADLLPADETVISKAKSFCRVQITGWPSGLNREQYNVLRIIKNNPHFEYSRGQQYDFDYLETIGAILRYQNGAEGNLLAVHPLLYSVL